MHRKSKAELKFNSNQDKESFVLGFLSIYHDHDCCLELVNKPNATIQLFVFGSPDKILIKEIENLYGSALIFNAEHENK